MSGARTWAWLVTCLLVLVVAPWIGPAMGDDAQAFILAELRVPRVMLGALVGATLGMTGAAYQIIFVNPLATPSTVGTTAGATLGALGVLVLAGGETALGLPLLVIAAFLGAIAATSVAVAVASSGRASTEDVLLAGIAVTLASSAIASGLQFNADMSATFAAVRWSLGNLAIVGFDRVWLLAPFVGGSVLVLWLHRRPLEALVVGVDRAHTQGVNVVRVRTWCLVAGALGVGASVALCGPIAFVGLIVPHLVRRLTGMGRAALLGGSAVGGAALLVLCDTVARVAWPGREIPVGVITAAVGAPALLWLLTRRRR